MSLHNEWKWFVTLLPPFFLANQKWTMMFKLLNRLGVDIRLERKKSDTGDKKSQIQKRSKGETRVKSPFDPPTGVPPVAAAELRGGKTAGREVDPKAAFV